VDEIELLKELTKNLPRFENGRIDYSRSDVAVTVTCFVKHEDDILLLKRSDKVREGRGKWCAVTGYFDEIKPVYEKAIEEVEEEIGINKSCIVRIEVGKAYKLRKAGGKLLVIYPVLVELENKPEISLDWEHTEYRWIKPDELGKFDVVPELDRVLKRVLD
jgi:8-oxo-dGTP pyrophosphatase MutT (NUDIX family)